MSRPIYNSPTGSQIGPLAQYGTQLVPASNLAILRGSGNYNPGPNYESTINRGPVFSQALNYYQNFGPKPIDAYEAPANNLDMSAEFNAVYPGDVQNLRKYQVGSSMMHPQSTNSWSRPDAYNSRGSDQYQVWAINSMNLQPNALLNFFFSEENVNYLLTEMQNEVRQIKNIEIARQSVDELLPIMRAKYLYALSGWLDHPDGPGVFPRGPLNASLGPLNASLGPVGRQGLAYYENGLETQIELLNRAVLQECLKQILSGISMYQQYYKDASSMPMQLDRPVMASEKGSRVLQENLAFEDGHEVSKAIASYNERFNIL